MHFTTQKTAAYINKTYENVTFEKKKSQVLI